MADRVIIVDVNRGKELLDMAMLKQMAGRVGRGEGQTGIVNIILNNEIYDEFIEAYDDESNLEVRSIFDGDIASFHLLSEIVSGRVTNLEQAQKWYESSFYYFQNKINEVESSINKLQEDGGIIISNDEYIYTYLGELANKYYFDVGNIKSWKDNFSSIFEIGIENEDVVKAWALSNVKGIKVGGDCRKYFGEIRRYEEELEKHGLYNEDGTKLSGICWWSFFGGSKVGKLISGIKEVRDNFGRIIDVLKGINYKEKWNKDKYFEDMETQFNYKIEEKYLFLCKINGISKSQAIYLYNEYGIKDIDDLLEKVEYLTEVISYETYCNIKRGNFS